MAPSEEPGGDSDRLKRAVETHSIETMKLLLLAKEELGDPAYKDKLVKTAKEIVKRSANPDDGITIEKRKEILSEVFVGRTRLLNSFHHFLQGRDPFHDEVPVPQDPRQFLAKVKASPYISDEDYIDLLSTLRQFSKTRTMTVEDIYQKAKRIMRHCPEFIEIFKTYLPPHLSGPLPIEQPCGSPKPSPMGKELLSFITPDANNSLDAIWIKATNISTNVSQLEYPGDQNFEGFEYPLGKTHTQMPMKEGDGKSLVAEEYEGDKIDPLPDWSPSRENELPPKVDLSICTPCTPSYCLLPEDRLTLQSSYRTELGRSIFNDTMVSVASGTEDCFKFRTKNQYEENIIKCEDDMFESDMLLQRFRATAEFIGHLQDQVDSDMKIQERLTPLHRRCIEQLYDDHGLDVIDALSETQNTSASLAVLHYRLNQKIEDLSVARLSLHKTCKSIIADNYYRSLDYRSSSFKQLDAKRMTPKALLAEAKGNNMKRLSAGVKHFSSSCNLQSLLASDDAHNSTDVHIHEDIKSIVAYAYHKKYSSEHKPVMIWTKLVQPFVSANCRLPDLNGTVAPTEACERCGLSKNFLKSILSAFVAKNFPLSSKTGECLGNKSTSVDDGCKLEIEEGEFIPCSPNVQMDAMLGPLNKAASYDVAAPSGDGLGFQLPESSICNRDNKADVQQESREGSNVEMGSLAYSKRVTEGYDVKGAKTCCSLVMLCRLHQMLYERLLVSKVLSREARAKALSRGLLTYDLYEEFKGELLKLLNGSTDSSNFEKYCLHFLGPGSYVLFTLDKLIGQVISQSPDRASNGSMEQDPDEEGKISKLHGTTVKPKQNLFHRRKKRKLDNSPARLSQPGVDDSNS
ncbi:hypothetical protein EJB05_52578 [Eragrostis curvula]|uniref:Histone deacetylase interacting domain-containing protein n=1 Tax=Eragrostis curvula TaxID=38414 RepID=A0A5J9SSE8_9POAL|nr:hypothetical protein EJB05_52578 [Eragrostis curvula]